MKQRWKDYSLKIALSSVILSALLCSPVKIEKHFLDWPVDFRSNYRMIGNNVNQFNTSTYPYFHGGIDILVDTKSWVTSPVAGVVKVGYYSLKYYKSGQYKAYWNNHKRKHYYRVVVRTLEGFEYQLHHINPKTVQVKNGQMVERGQRLGKAIKWFRYGYHHIHYNIMSPRGDRMNAIYYSKKIPDAEAPKIHRVYAAKNHLHIETTDRIGNDTVAPTYVAVNDYVYDFRKGVTRRADTRDVYNIRKSRFSYYTFKIPLVVIKKPYKITVGDTNENYTTFLIR